MLMLTIIIGAMLALAGLYFASETARNWMKSVWYGWFRDSEINLVADMLTTLGGLAEIASDPALQQLLMSVGLNPVWLLVAGVALRIIRGFRDREMIPLTKYPEQ